MKFAILSLILLFTINTVYSQTDTTKIIEEWYNPDLGIWEVKSALYQEFDGNILRKKSFADSYYSTGYMQLRTFEEVGYNESGQLLYELDSTYYPFSDIFKGTRTDYYYENNQLVESLSHYQNYDLIYELNQRTIYEHNTEGKLLLSQKFFNQNFEDKLIEQIDYQYDENDCLKQVDIWKSNVWPDRIVYKNNADCTPFETIDYYYQDWNDEGLKENIKTIPFDIKIGNHRIIGDSLFYINSNSIWVHNYNVENEFNENGLIVRKRMRLSNGSFGEEIWKRDYLGQVIAYTSFEEISNSDTLISPLSYQREYTLDENGFVIADSRLYTVSGNIEKRTYENYCDGKLKFEYYENLELFSVPTRIYYEYNEPELECDKPISSTNFHLYPNPTDGTIYLETDALQEFSAQIKIFSLLGQLVYQENFTNQGFRANIDLGHLEAGNYIVYVVGNQLRTVKKLVIKPH